MTNQNYIEKNKSSYDEMSSYYRTRRERGDFKIYFDIVKFVDLVEESFSNPKVLDIGPGAGVVLKYFSDRKFKTSAIDISSKMLEVAKEVSPETECFLGNFLDYDFGDMKFEGLFAKAILHLFTEEDANSFVTKSQSLLTNSGLLYLSAFFRNVSKEGFMTKNMCGKEFIRYSKDWTISELEFLIDNSSFSIIHTFSEQHGTMKKWSSILKN